MICYIGIIDIDITGIDNIFIDKKKQFHFHGTASNSYIIFVVMTILQTAANAGEQFSYAAQSPVYRLDLLYYSIHPSELQ